jgi:hypothetical protein
MRRRLTPSGVKVFQSIHTHERTFRMSTHRALAERFARTLTDHDLDAFAELLDD